MHLSAVAVSLKVEQNFHNCSFPALADGAHPTAPRMKKPATALSRSPSVLIETDTRKWQLSVSAKATSTLHDRGRNLARQT
jgi:hypothetical protein